MRASIMTPQARDLIIKCIIEEAPKLATDNAWQAAQYIKSCLQELYPARIRYPRREAARGRADKVLTRQQKIQYLSTLPTLQPAERRAVKVAQWTKST